MSSAITNVHSENRRVFRNNLLLNLSLGSMAVLGGGILTYFAISFIRVEGFLPGFLLFAVIGIAICVYGAYLTIQAMDRRTKLVVSEQGVYDAQSKRWYDWEDLANARFNSFGNFDATIKFDSQRYGECAIGIGGLSLQPFAIYNLILATSHGSRAQVSSSREESFQTISDLLLDDSALTGRVIERLSYGRSKAWLHFGFSAGLGSLLLALSVPTLVKKNELALTPFLGLIALGYAAFASRRLWDGQTKLSILEDGIYDHRKKRFHTWRNCESVAVNAQGEDLLTLTHFMGNATVNSSIDIANLDKSPDQIFQLVTQALQTWSANQRDDCPA